MVIHTRSSSGILTPRSATRFLLSARLDRIFPSVPGISVLSFPFARKVSRVPTHSRVSNVWDQESIELPALPLIPETGMSGGTRRLATFNDLCVLLTSLASFQLPNPLLEELPLWFLLGQRQSFLIGGPGLSRPAEPAVHIRTG